MAEGVVWPLTVDEVRRDQWLARARHLAELCEAMAIEVQEDDPTCAMALRSSTARLRQIAQRREDQGQGAQALAP
jgi:hypothetical protein